MLGSPIGVRGSPIGVRGSPIGVRGHLLVLRVTRGVRVR